MTEQGRASGEAPAERRKLLLYLVTEDWFFASHFVPMGRAALERGFRVAIAGRLGAAAEGLRAEGFEMIPLNMGRGGAGGGGALLRLIRLLRRERPAVVHMIALRPILFGLAAWRFAPGGKRIMALTGQGFLGASSGRVAGLARSSVMAAVGRAARSRESVLLFENPEDRTMLERWSGPLPDERVLLLPGAGVDLERFPVSPEPEEGPVRIGVVARMVWSKGVDVAVEAHRQLRKQGLDVELVLAGSPDRENPAAIPEETLRGWAKEPGVTWLGRVNDVPALWKSVHIALLASRGGEGLPKSLLEAAASGRPVVTTDVPGCRRLVRQGQEGFVVPADDAQALAEALGKLVRDKDLRVRLGQAARTRIEAEFTEAHVAQAVGKVY